MTDDGGRAAREAAERFGKKLEEAASNVGEAIGALRGDKPPPPDDQPTEEPGDNITINVNR